MKGGGSLVSFDGFAWDGDGPIYHQIIQFLKRGMAAGTVRDGDEMPSRRVLSARLGVNPNTIQKAYRLLEEEGLIQSRAGAKSYVALEPERIGIIRRQLLEADAGRLGSAMRQTGWGREEALELIGRLWDEEGGAL